MKGNKGEKGWQVINLANKVASVMSNELETLVCWHLTAHKAAMEIERSNVAFTRHKVNLIHRSLMAHQIEWK